MPRLSASFAKLLLAGILGTVLVFSCEDSETPLAPEPETSFLDDVPATLYDIQTVAAEEIWDSSYGIVDTTRYNWDEDRVILNIRNGLPYYNPITLVNFGLAFLSNYIDTQLPRHLQIARNHADRLIAEANEFDGVYYFPYKFDFALHGRSDEVDQMIAPWYSGLAQGRALGLFVRMYRTTGEERYLDAAHKTFGSLLRPRNENVPWVVEVDSAGFFWIEEYPATRPNQVLNGFIYAMYGLHDYYTETRDENARLLLQASLTTVRHYLYDFRVTGDLSYYCLSHKTQIPTYHRWHIDLIKNAFRMSGDPYFETAAQAFWDDLYLDDGVLEATAKDDLNLPNFGIEPRNDNRSARR